MDDTAPSNDPAGLVDALVARIGHRFTDASIAQQALTHSSAKDKDHPSNERLEFFGDAVLGLVVSEHLYHRFPAYEEGELSAMKSIIVSAKTLSAAAHELGLDRLLLLGRGLSDKKSLPRSLLGNAFEALIGALYLDAGLDKARAFVLEKLEPAIATIAADAHEKNYKSLLQDYAQRHVSSIPLYRVTKEEGPDHRKRFQVVVDLDGRTYGPSWGHNKKEAEQNVARMALEALGLLPPPSEAAPDPS